MARPRSASRSLLALSAVPAVVSVLIVVACGGKTSDSAVAPSPLPPAAVTPADAGAFDAAPHVQGDLIQRMCVFGSCPSAFPTRFGDLQTCLSDERFRQSVFDTSSEQRRQCAASATTCEAWIDCMTFHQGDYCKTHPGESCSGNVAFHCDSSDVPSSGPPESCALIPGTRCQMVRNYDLFVQEVSICTTGEACTPGTTPPTCAGDKGLVTCDGTSQLMNYSPCNKPSRPDFNVAVRGSQVCMPPGACLPVSTPCTTEGVTCAGTVATDCRYSFAVSFDCARSGQACRPRGAAVTPDCVPSSLECDPASFVPSCTGATLKLCVLGKLETVDCAAYGFDRCSSRGCGP